MWDCDVPLKIKVFTWIILKGRLNTKALLHHKGALEDTPCVFCDQEETIEHLFLHCGFVTSIWQSVKHNLGINSQPDSIQSLWSSRR